MLIFLLACSYPAPEWQVGQTLADLRVDPIHWEEGVYPDTSVLDNPNNPFRDGIDSELKWEILATDPTPGYYAFATALAMEPVGEHQFYTASCLQQVYDSARIDPEDLYWAWSASVRGYQKVLDQFPDSVTYDADGVTTYALAPSAYYAILALGATPQGWIEVVDADGVRHVIQEGK